MADEETNRLLQELLNAVSQSGGRQTPEVAKANEAYQKQVAIITKGNTQEGKRQSLTSKAMLTTQKAVRASLNVAKGLENASNALRENRESFSSLNPSIEMAGKGLAFAGKTAGIVTTGLSSMASGIPLAGGAIAGLGAAAGKAMAAIGEMAGEIVTAVGKTFTAELDRVNTAFRTLGQTGALGAEGMSGLGRQAINAGLSFNQFAKVVNKESQSLAFAFGTSADAAKGLSDTTKAMRPFREQLLTLGIGVEQQNELTSKYITFQQRQGRNEINNTKALAEGSQAYMKNLQTLSKITGQSIEEQQKAVDAVQRDVRQGASIREIERTSGKKAAQATLNTITTLNKIPGLETIGDGLADALSNAGTPAAQEFLKVMGPVGGEIIAGLKSGAIGQAEALSMIQKQGSSFYKGLGGDAFAATAGKMGTSIEALLPALQTLMLSKDLGMAAEKAAEQTNKLAKTEDGLTKDVVAAQEKMISSATALDEVVLNKLLPAAAASINKFAEIQATVITSMIKYSDILVNKGIKGLGEAVGGDVLKKMDVDKKETTSFFDTTLKVLSGMAVGGGTGAAYGAAAGAVTGPGAILTGLTGGIGGAILGGLTAYFGKDALPSFFGGGKAEGGAAKAGGAYLVGENGPEMLKMGKTSGVVIPGQMGPGVPGRIPGTFDVKLGDGTKVTVDAKGNELHRSTPTMGGLSMSSFADGSVSGSYTSTQGQVKMRQDYVGGAGVSGDGLGGMYNSGTSIRSGPFSTYQSGKMGANEGIASTSYNIGDGQTISAQSAAGGGRFDALGQLRSTAGPTNRIGDKGGMQLDTDALAAQQQGGPPGARSQVMEAGNEKLVAIMEAMLGEQTKTNRLQGEQLQAARNN